MKTSLTLGIIIGILLTALVFTLLLKQPVFAPETPLEETSNETVVAPPATNTSGEEAVETDSDVQKDPEVGHDTEMEFPTLDDSALILTNRNLTEVPVFIFDRTDLTLLDLSYNKLTSVQAEVGRLTNLRTLDLSHNTLTNIPAELGKLTNLRTLDLSDNKLTGLPYELGNLTNLETLDLRGNNYARADLEIIKKGLSGTDILTDN